MTEERLEQIKSKFNEINEKYEIFTPELKDFLGEDFFLAPASPSLDMYYCYPGGLVEFLMNVCKYAVNINETLPESIKIDKKSLVRTIFLSQIGKTFLFKLNENEWMVKNKGKMYEYRDDDIVIMSVGERSAYYAISNGVKLSDVEYQAILNSDKEQTERFMRGSKPLYYVMKMGVEIALMEVKNGE